MAIIPRILIENYVEKYQVSLAEVCCITFIKPDTLEAYMARQIKRLSIHDRARLTRLNVKITDIFDKDSYTSEELCVLGFIGYAGIPIEEISKLLSIRESAIQKLLDGEHPTITPVHAELATRFMGSLPTPDEFREKALNYVRTRIPAYHKREKEERDKIATGCYVMFKKMFDAFSCIDNRKASKDYREKIASLQEDLDSKAAELEKANKEIDALKAKLYRMESASYIREDTVKCTSDPIADELYHKDLIIQSLQDRLAKKEENRDGIAVKELYDGELDYILSDAINQYIDNNSTRRRRIDLLTEFKNAYVTSDVDATRNLIKDVEAQLGSIDEWFNLKRIKKVGPFRFSIVSENSHIKFCINDDERYNVVVSVSPSDHRSRDEALRFFMRNFT